MGGEDGIGIHARPEPTDAQDMTDTGKAERYAALVAARKDCHACTGLVNPSDVDGGKLDS